MNPHHQRVVELARSLTRLDARQRRPKPLKALIKFTLEQEHWYVSTKFKVEDRGSNDGQRGVLDLIAWPPPRPEPNPDRPPHIPVTDIRNRPPPVLIEIDKGRVYLKTRSKFQAFPYPRSASVVILTNADDSEPCQGIDTIVCLGATS